MIRLQERVTTTHFFECISLSIYLYLSVFGYFSCKYNSSLITAHISKSVFLSICGNLFVWVFAFDFNTIKRLCYHHLYLQMCFSICCCLVHCVFVCVFFMKSYKSGKPQAFEEDFLNVFKIVVFTSFWLCRMNSNPKIMMPIMLGRLRFVDYWNYGIWEGLGNNLNCRYS